METEGRPISVVGLCSHFFTGIFPSWLTCSFSLVNLKKSTGLRRHSGAAFGCRGKKKPMGDSYAFSRKVFREAFWERMLVARVKSSSVQI